MKNILLLLLVMVFSLASQAQAGPESRLDELKAERDELKLELVGIDRKLESNRLTKGIGIGLTVVGAIVFWPAIIPGLPMWIASPTKKWVRKRDKIENRLQTIEDRISDLKYEK